MTEVFIVRFKWDDEQCVTAWHMGAMCATLGEAQEEMRQHEEAQARIAGTSSADGSVLKVEILRFTFAETMAAASFVA